MNARILVLFLTISLLGHTSTIHAGPIGYTLGAGTLHRFDLSSPGVLTNLGVISGPGFFAESLDFRPADGLLYGYSSFQNTVFTINPNTLVSTLVSTPTTASSSSFLGIDFNPVVDRLRLVNSNDQNLRIDVATGATAVDGTLAYAAGDPNFGSTLWATDVAYTNSDTNPATGTSLYYIDVIRGVLATTSSPNAGVLNTVGSLGLGMNFISFTGFDIQSNGIGGNTAYAILRAGSSQTTKLYQINLTNGAATDLGVLGDGGLYRGLAIVQPTVPEPSSIVIGLGLFCMGLQNSIRRRR